MYDSTYIGFLWVAGVYATLLLFLFLIRKPLFQGAMRNAVIANLMELWTESNSVDTNE